MFFMLFTESTMTTSERGVNALHVCSFRASIFCVELNRPVVSPSSSSSGACCCLINLPILILILLAKIQIIIFRKKTHQKVSEAAAAAAVGSLLSTTHSPSPSFVEEGKIIMTLMGLFVINLTNLLDSRIHLKEEISPHHEQIAHLGTRGGPSSHR